MISLLASILIATQPISNDIKATKFGELVEAYSKGRKEPPSEIYDLMLQHASPDSSVLDIGCGTGLSTKPLFERFKEVRGVDHDSRMLAVAKQDSAHENQFDEASVYDLPYRDEKFDMVTLFSCYHWFCNDKATQEISRVLKKDGFICIAKPNNSPFKPRPKALAGVEWVDASKENYCPIEILEKNGFTVVLDQMLPTQYTYTVDEAVERMKSGSGWNDIIASGKEEEALAELQKISQAAADENGLIHNQSETRIIMAKKTI